MSKIATVFAELKAQGRKGLVPFITAGDPEPGLTLDLLHALVRGGADVIELGMHHCLLGLVSLFRWDDNIAFIVSMCAVNLCIVNDMARLWSRCFNF